MKSTRCSTTRDTCMLPPRATTDFPVLKPVFILGLPSPQLITPCCLSVLTCLQICKRSGKQLQKILSCVESAFAFKERRSCDVRACRRTCTDPERGIGGRSGRMAATTTTATAFTCIWNNSNNQNKQNNPNRSQTARATRTSSKNNRTTRATALEVTTAVGGWQCHHRHHYHHNQRWKKERRKHKKTYRFR